MPRTSEVALNTLIAEVLRGKHPLWSDNLHVEQTGALRDAPRARPDLLVDVPGSQPVVIETEFDPASAVEDDAKARLGKTPTTSSYPIEQVIAVRIPAALQRDQVGMIERIAAAGFGYCVFSGDAAAPKRWPETGWLKGGVDHIARCIEHAMVSQRLIDESMSILEEGVQIAAQAVRSAGKRGFTDVERDLGRVLNQREGEQTTRMAMTIIANALTFHDAISGAHDVISVAQLKIESRGAFRLRLLETWGRILDEVNYWPIFKVASDLLAPLRAETAPLVLDALADAAERLARIGIATRHDLSGRMFQNLIVDRKFLATFYTLPTSAALLAELAVARMDADWNDLDAYPDLRIADLSCGTGTLLSAAYHAVLVRYRRAGGDDGRIHRQMIEQAIVAADIMPAAAHLCASQLSSVHPNMIFDNTRVYTMPYGIGVGEEHGRGVAIGSLDLTIAAQTRSLFATGQRQAHGAREDLEVQDIELAHESVDLMIMNPPFTRPTGHEGDKIGTPVPSFAGFRTTADEQRAMSDRLAAIRKALEAPVGHGNAGLASNFIDLAHAKVKPGGVLALVLPIAAVQGSAWSASRKLLADRYKNTMIVTIAASGNHDRAFSADTGMAEALIIATKLHDGGSGAAEPAMFVNLRRRPATLLEAAESAKLVARLQGVSAAGRLRAGDQTLGSYIQAPLNEGGCAALRESAIADTMMALQLGELRMSRYGQRLSMPICPLGEIGERGLYHLDIGTANEERPPFRGPFRIVPLQGVPNYPILWSHQANRERSMTVESDREGEVRQGCEDRAVAAWQTATRLHFNRDFRLNSQSLAACLTPGRALGGRAWPNFRLADARWEEAMALWANCTLGLMLFWWAGSRQQQGRVALTISELPKLAALDPRMLSEAKIDQAKVIFKRFQDAAFLPAHEACRDDARKCLDRAVLVELLETPEDVLDPLNNLRRQWCDEPSVRGGKK